MKFYNTNFKFILGATISDINERFPQIPVDELKELIQLNQVFRVGIVKTRFVTEKFSNPWLLHSFDIKRRHREAVADDIGAVNYCNPTVRFPFFLNILESCKRIHWPINRLVQNKNFFGILGILLYK